MKLTRIERWMLSNQYRILEALYPDEDDAKHYREAREALERGYTLHYRWIAEHIGEEELTEEQCKEVGDILWMFEELQRGYNRSPDKSGIKESDVIFLGFDGNNESGLSSYAEYFRNSGGGRFPELKMSPGLDSHMPILAIYRRMLAEWEKATVKTELSMADVKRIIAPLHPPVVKSDATDKRPDKK